MNLDDRRGGTEEGVPQVGRGWVRGGLAGEDRLAGVYVKYLLGRTFRAGCTVARDRSRNAWLRSGLPETVGSVHRGVVGDRPAEFIVLYAGVKGMRIAPRTICDLLQS